jgi:hypothetical protein
MRSQPRFRKKSVSRDKYPVSPLGKLDGVPHAVRLMEVKDPDTKQKVQISILEDVRRFAHKRGRLSSTSCWINGMFFRSVAEARRYSKLLYLQNHGVIFQLETQPGFKIEHNGVVLARPKFDFRFVYPEEGVIIEDVKGMITEKFEMNMKLMAAFYPNEKIFII